MLRACTVICLMLIAAVGVRAAEVVPLNAGADVLTVELPQTMPGRIVLDYELGSFVLDVVEIGGRTFSTVTLEGESRLMERGLPALPSVRRSVAIPDDAEMGVSVVSSHFVEFEGIDIAPSKGEIARNIDPATVPFEFDGFYDSDAWYPAELAGLRDPYILRDVRGAVVVLNPFQYNPSRRTLRVYDRVSIELLPVGPGKLNVLTSRARAARISEFERIYSRHFLNYDSYRLVRYTPVSEVGEMLVIAHDAFMPATQPLVDWKNQMGVPCEMVGFSTVGTTAGDLRDYIQDRYDSSDLVFVLLVGDAEQIPTLVANGGTSDPSFSLVAGSDVYPDILLGRLSAETVPEVETQVLRTVEYEKSPQAGADWYHRGTGIASDQGPGDDGEFDNEHVDNIRVDLLGFTYTLVDQIYDPGADPQMVADALNGGRGIVNYTGHGNTLGWGSSDFASSDVNALTNDNELPFIWSVACMNGAFSGRTCFAETWMRATNGAEPTGAVAVLMSSINQDWDEPMDAQDEMIDLLVAGARRTFGGLSANGNCHMLDEYGTLAHDDFLSWHTFGDPSLRVRTDTPALLSVEHADTLNPASTIFEVSVPGVEGALCALYHDGDYHGSAFTDAAGSATIDIEGVLPALEEVTVTVTAFNAVPYIGAVQVSEAYEAIVEVLPSSFSVRLEPGEAATDTMTIGNLGEPLSVLFYDIEVSGSGMSRHADPSGITVEPVSCEPGSTLDLVFTLTNEGTDGEWIRAASLRFPDGVTVNYCADFTVAERALRWDGVAGDGVRVGWEGNWWNVVYPGESSQATVNVTVDPGLSGNVDLVFGIEGDGYGDPPHSLSGTLTVDCGATPPLTLLSPNGDEAWGVGQTRDILWDPSGWPLQVDLFISEDGGVSWMPIVVETDDDGQYSWLVDAPISDNCLVAVSLSVDHAMGDLSDRSFSVYQPVEWLSVSPTNGIVAQGETAAVTVDFDSSGMPDGEYFADMVVHSNGGDPVVVPVNLTVTATGTDDRIPDGTVVYGNYPNPFYPSTRIAFSLPAAMRVTIDIYSIGGSLVRSLEDDLYGPGRHSVQWDGRSDSGNELASGVYYYRLEVPGKQVDGKMVLLR